MLAVIGGGCFGAYHGRQLAGAVAAGRAVGPVVIVDRDPTCRACRELGGHPDVELVRADWGAFLGRWLSRAGPEDHLIPAPLAPHLLWEWLAAELGASPASTPRRWGLPYEVAGAGGAIFLSMAAWRCPATCIEPAHCPALHSPRDWDLAGFLEQGAIARGYHPAVFRCLHLAAGVGSVSAASILATRDRLAALPSGNVLVATSSHCHAAVGAFRVKGPHSG
jgi:hypothetical protein